MAPEQPSRRARDEQGQGERDQLATAPATTRHPVDEVLPAGPMFMYGLQHVMSMYAGVVAVPLIVGGAMGLAEGPAPGLTPEYQPGGHLPHEDAFTNAHRPTDVDQGPLPPRTVSPSTTTGPPYETEPDKETPQ